MKRNKSIRFLLIALVVIVATITTGLVSGALPSLGGWKLFTSPLAPPPSEKAAGGRQTSPLGTPVPLPEKQATALPVATIRPTVPPPDGWPTDVPWPPPTPTPWTPQPTPTRPPSLVPVGFPPADQQSLYYMADNAGYSELHVVGMDEQGKKQSEFGVAVALPYEDTLVGLHSSSDGKYLAVEFSLGPQDNLLLVMERTSGRIWCPLGEEEQCLGGFWDWTKDNQLLFRPTAGNQLEGVIPGGALLVDINTGRYIQLDLPTSPDGVYSYAHNVSLSPDDSRIAYAVTYFEEDKEISEVWTMRMDGQDRQLVCKMEGVINILSWSPVGEQLVYFYRPGTLTASSEPSELWLVNSDGSGSRLLANQTRDASDGIYGPTWSPDGRYVAFMQTDDHALYLSDLSRLGTNVYVADTTTGEIVRLSTFEERNNYLPTWSPDGRSVAFVSTGRLEEETLYSEVWVASTDGSQLYAVSETAKQYSPLAWLPPLSSQKGEER